MKDPFDIHQAITDHIIAAIETGVGACTMPWQRAGLGGSLPRNALTKASYNGINVLSLWVAGATRGYTHDLWATYKQWQELGAQVRKGEKSSLICFYKQYDAKPDPERADDDGKRRVAKASWVFNVDQVDGFTLPPSSLVDMGPIEREAKADAVIARHKIDIRYGGDMAYYRPSEDYIQMPEEHRFIGSNRTEAFYSVLFHEAGHWTGAKGRLNRDLTGRFGTEAYAIEELCAELTASFCCAELGISATPRADHAAYVNNWLSVMKADKRAVFAAAAKASEATRYLLG